VRRPRGSRPTPRRPRFDDPDHAPIGEREAGLGTWNVTRRDSLAGDPHDVAEKRTAGRTTEAFSPSVQLHHIVPLSAGVVTVTETEKTAPASTTRSTLSSE